MTSADIRRVHHNVYLIIRLAYLCPSKLVLLLTLAHVLDVYDIYARLFPARIRLLVSAVIIYVIM